VTFGAIQDGKCSGEPSVALEMAIALGYATATKHYDYV